MSCRHNPSFSVYILRLSVFLLALLIFFTSNGNDIFAHAPHDELYDIALSPNYDQDETLYIIVRGDLFKSTDGGESWRRLVNGLDNDHRLSSLTISARTDKILFLSTLGDGIYKSQNEGKSWFKVNQGLETLSIDLLSMSPASSDVVIAAGTDQGLYRTGDGGKTWYQVVNTSKITALAFFSDPKDYVVAGDNQGGLWFSADSGQTWKLRYTIADAAAITAFAVSPYFSSDSTFFVGTEACGVLKTIDGGLTFFDLDDGLSSRSIVSLTTMPANKTDFMVLATTWHDAVFRFDNRGTTWRKYSEGLTKNPQAVQLRRPNFSVLRVSSKNNVVYLGGFDGLFKSSDGGRTWQELETLSSSIVIGFALSPAYQNDSTLAISTYLGGVYLTKDHGKTWRDANKSLVRFSPFQKGVVRLHDIVFSPDYQIDKTLFLGVGNGLLKSTDNGLSWYKIPLTTDYLGFKRLIKAPRLRLPRWLSDFAEIPVDSDTKYKPYVIAVSPNFKADQTLYLGTSEGAIFESTTGGENLSIVARLNNPISSLVISPDFSSDQTLYAVARGEGVFKTEDAGHTWQLINNDLVSVEKRIRLAISPHYSQDNIVFAGTTDGLFKTQNGGSSWHKLPSSAYSESGTIVAMAISPDFQNDQTLIVSVKGEGLFKSVDGGASFFRIGEALIDNNRLLSSMNHFPPTSSRIRFSPTYAFDNTIYGTSGTEFFRSTDGGQTWDTLTIPKCEENNNLIFTLYDLFSAFPILGILVAFGAISVSIPLLSHYINRLR